jgi:murein hydrolase activator
VNWAYLGWRDRPPCNIANLAHLRGTGTNVGLTLASKCALGAAIAALLAMPLLAFAQDASPDETRKRLEADKNRLDATQRRSKEIKADLEKIASERERINARLIETGKLIHQSEAQLTIIESKVDQLQAQEKQLRTTLEERHGTISGLLAAMQRMGRNPPPVMITRREDALSMVRSAMLLAAAFPELRGQAISLAQQLNDLARVMTSIRTEGEKLKAEAGRLSEARTRLAALQEVKRQSQSERQAELDSVLKTASQIARNVEDLSDLIGKLDKEVAARTELGSYEKEMAAAEQQGAAPDSRAAAAVLAPSAGTVAMLSPGRIRPDIPFMQARGQLPMPAQGKRVFGFGDKTQYGTQSKGLVIQTRHGGQVVSPCDGWIVYAGEFRTYGKLLIVNAGGGYHILLAGLSQIDVQFGQFVLTGEAVGVMSPVAKAPQQAGKAQDSGPVLYVEFRKDGRPIDPDPWWSDASRKVQG